MVGWLSSMGTHIGVETNEMKLKDRVALVTGANTGIGRAIALRFANDGANVVVNYLTHPEKTESLVREIKRKGRDAMPIKADVSRVPEVYKMVESAVDRFGRIDICVNNAGVQKEKVFLDVSEDDWNLMTSVDLKGAFFVSQACARDMAKRRRGRILNISSVHQAIAKPHFSPYCAAKGGIGMLTRTLAMELAEYHINVNGIAPGAISTPMNEDVMEDDEALKSVIAEIPWGRFGKPSEVAALAAWLVSDEADYVTGATFFIDGGLTQQVVDYHDPGTLVK
jgi:glucose 1-dehydrogenase